MSKDTIKVLEWVLEARKVAPLVPAGSYPSEAEVLAALTLAIDALKSKSDAEVIVEWLEKNKEYGLYVGSENGRNLWLVDTLDEREIAAPTLSELATKLKDTQTERHAMTANVKLAERLEALRFDPRHHIGAGDIRLTLAQQDEIIAALRSPSPAQGMYSVEDIEGWLLDFTHNCLHTARDIHLRHEQFGIAAWKAKQLETQQEPRT